MVLGTAFNFLGGGGGPAASGPALAFRDAGPAAHPDMEQGWAGQEAALSPVLQTGLVADAPLAVAPHSASFSQNATEGAAVRSGPFVVIRDAQLDQLLAARRTQPEARAFAASEGSAVRSVAFEGSHR